MMQSIKGWSDRWGAFAYFFTGILDFSLASVSGGSWEFAAWFTLGIYFVYRAFSIRWAEINSYQKLAQQTQELLNFVEKRNELEQQLRNSSND